MCSSSQFTKLSQNSFKRLVWPPDQKHLYVPTPDTFMPIDEVKVMDKMHTHIKRTPTSFPNKCQNQVRVKIKMKCERSSPIFIFALLQVDS